MRIFLSFLFFTVASIPLVEVLYFTQLLVFWKLIGQEVVIIHLAVIFNTVRSKHYHSFMLVRSFECMSVSMATAHPHLHCMSET